MLYNGDNHKSKICDMFFQPTWYLCGVNHLSKLSCEYLYMPLIIPIHTPLVLLCLSTYVPLAHGSQFVCLSVC